MMIQRVVQAALLMLILTNLLSTTASSAISINFGQTLSGSISSSAETDSYTFLANANDNPVIRVSKVSGNIWPGIRLYGPAETQLNETYTSPTTEVFRKLPSTVEYTILTYDGFNGVLTLVSGDLLG
jgi:hypothetical protein